VRGVGAKKCTVDTFVKVDEAQVQYYYNRTVVSPATYRSALAANGVLPYHPECNGMLDVGYNDAAVGLVFSGTSISVTIIRDRAGCVADMVLDGNIVRGIDNLDKDGKGTKDCTSASVTLDGLADGKHNITLVHANMAPGSPRCWFYVKGFKYTPSNPTIITCPIPKKIIIGSAFGGAAGFILLVWVLAKLYKYGYLSCRLPSIKISLSLPPCTCCCRRRSKPPAATPAAPPAAAGVDERMLRQLVMDENTSEAQVTQAIRKMRMANRSSTSDLHHSRRPSGVESDFSSAYKSNYLQNDPYSDLAYPGPSTPFSTGKSRLSGHIPPAYGAP